ncbi:MAG: ABC transporter permease [Dongiaceae bacterium]
MVSATSDLTLARTAAPGLGARLRMLVRRSEALRGHLLLSPTLLVMVGMLIMPIVALVAASFWTQVYFDLDRTFTLKNYWTIIKPTGEIFYLWGFLPLPRLETPIYVVLLGKSLMMSLIATTVIILMAYPMAYFLAFRVMRHKILWIILISVPFWTSYLLRVFAWKVILGYNGVINSGLISLGLIEEPLQFLLYNPTSVIITLTHAWLAFAILPIYVSLEKIDRSLLEAATDLGDGPVQRFFRVTLPLSLPGTISSSLLVFIPTVGDYVTPTLVGGTSGIMIGNVIQTLFGKANNAPLGAAVSLTMMLVVTLIVCAFIWMTGYQRMRKRET